MQDVAGTSRDLQAQGPLEEPQDFGGCHAVRLGSLGLGYCHQGENQCTLYRIGPAVGKAVPPMNGRARRGSIRPFSIGFFHFVLPSAGVVAVGHLQCLTTLVMGGNSLSRLGGTIGIKRYLITTSERAVI